MASEGQPPGDSEEDWQVYRVLCLDDDFIIPRATEDPGGEMSHDTATSLRSELAALQYKRDRLLQELQDAKGQLRSREQRYLELQVETEQLKEQAARQTAIIASLRKRIQELEDKERNLTVSQGRAEMAVQTLQRENQYKEEKVKNLEKRVHALELECHSEEMMKESQRRSMEDLVRRLSTALGAEYAETMITSPEGLIHKASELVQETSRLRTKSGNVSETLSSVELELKGCKDALDRALAERDSLQRQAASHLLEIDRIQQEKENLEMQQRVRERELLELREKLSLSNRSLSSATDSVAVQEATICQLREDLNMKDEKLQKVQNELLHFLESLAIQLSSPVRFVDSNDTSIKERIREVLLDNKEKATQVDHLKDKVSVLVQQLNRQTEVSDQASAQVRKLQDENAVLESRLHKVESELASLEVSRDSLRRDKNTFMSFLERLARVLNVEEISKEAGVDLHTETLLLRAEQLARLESDKLLDKYLYVPPYVDYYWWRYGTFPRLRRERSFHEFPLKETSTVYQLQRRVRTLREQLQRRDLHLDLLRRKLSLQEDNTRIKTLLEAERDDANLRVKKLLKQVERLQLQLSEARSQTRELKTQLADAAEYKITALERARKIEELQKRLVESEMLRTRYNRKVTILKDQVRTTGQSAEEERSLHEHNIHLLREELSSIKQSFADIQRRENALLSFRTSVAKLLNLDGPLPDYEIISRLQKLVQAHRDFTMVSRRYDDPLMTGGSRTPLLLGHSPAGTRTPRYDDSGFVDPPDLSVLEDSDDINGIYNKRPLRSSPP